MNQKTFLLISGIVFLVVAVLHALRLVLGWVAVIGSWVVPQGLSAAALLVAGYLAYTAFRLRV